VSHDVEPQFYSQGGATIHYYIESLKTTREYFFVLQTCPGTSKYSGIGIIYIYIEFDRRAFILTANQEVIGFVYGHGKPGKVME